MTEDPLESRKANETKRSCLSLHKAKFIHLILSQTSYTQQIYTPLKVGRLIYSNIYSLLEKQVKSNTLLMEGRHYPLLHKKEPITTTLFILQ